MGSFPLPASARHQGQHLLGTRAGRGSWGGGNDPLTKGHTEGQRIGDRNTTQPLHCYLESLREPSWLHQLLPKPPPPGRRFLTDSRFVCSISGGSFPKFLLHDFWWLCLLWGKRECLPCSAGEGEEVSLSKFSARSAGFAADAAAAAAASGLSSPGRAHPGAEAASKGAGEGWKVQQRPAGAGPCPSGEEALEILPFLQLCQALARPPVSLSRSHRLARGQRLPRRPRRPPGCPQTRRGARRARIPGPGMFRARGMRLRARAGCSGSRGTRARRHLQPPLRGGRTPARAPTPRCAALRTSAASPADSDTGPPSV